MRISDWSSDECSSDLPLFLLLLQGCKPSFFFPLRIVSKSDPLTVSRNGRMVEWSDPAPLGGTPRNPFRPLRFESVTHQLTALFGADASIIIRQPLYGEIGSASVRERVCQSV